MEGTDTASFGRKAFRQLFSANGEGWGLHERLAAESGWYEGDPAACWANCAVFRAPPDGRYGIHVTLTRQQAVTIWAQSAAP